MRLQTDETRDDALSRNASQLPRKLAAVEHTDSPRPVALSILSYPLPTPALGLANEGRMTSSALAVAYSATVGTD